MGRAVIAMSGGVDSSVAALIMKQQGWDCVGATMLLNRGAVSDDALAVCERLGIPFHSFELYESFENEVIKPFIESYEKGQTPNPCVECNRKLKFGIMLEKLKELNADCVVTGHYAKIEQDENGKYILKRAEDLSKDQSYVLYMLTQEQLSRVKLPLGEFTKAQIREIAQQNGFVNANKKDSQDICFVPDGDYVKFIGEYTGKKYPHGDFTDKDGNVFGQHKGIINYTVGQRKGLGIAYKKPLYVQYLDCENNRVVLGDNEDLFTDTVLADNVNIISGEPLLTPVRVTAKIRYRHNPDTATAWQDSGGILHIKFDKPQRAVTKGQSAVLYDGDIVLGGGTII